MLISTLDFYQCHFNLQSTAQQIACSDLAEGVRSGIPATSSNATGGGLGYCACVHTLHHFSLSLQGLLYSYVNYIVREQ
jgi:hypothetical protein